MHTVKKPVVHTHFFGETRDIVNGHVVKDTVINTAYDGKILHIDKHENNRLANYDIKDKQLKILLLRPTSKINLLDRLRQSYGDNKRTHKRNNKRNRKKKNKTKRYS